MSQISTESFVVILWALIDRMEGDQLDAACDDLLRLPVTQGKTEEAEQAQALVRLLREEAGRRVHGR